MPKNDPAVTKSIQAQDAQFAKLFNGKQFDRLVQDYYTQDARILPPNHTVVEGRDRILSFLKEMGDQSSDVRPETPVVLASGDLAVAHGTYRMKIRTEEGTIVEDRGKFIEAFRKEPDGSWKCFLDSFNSDLEPEE